MSARPARFEIAHTAAGYHARFRAAGNLRVVWTTEVYRRRADAVKAVEFWGELYHSPFQAWPEVKTTQGLLEIRDVDERTP